MDVQGYVGGYGEAAGIWWADAEDEQEDELDDVHKDILDAPTDDEGPGSVDEANDSAVALEKADEDDELIEGDEAAKPH